MSNVKGQGFEFSNGYTYLMLKAEEGNFEEVQKILADLQQPNINALNRNGSTALSLAAKNGSYGIVEALVQAGADVNIKNSSGQSPLFLACWNNFRDIVKLLLQNNAEINTKDQRGWTPLMIAAYNSHKEIVKLLIDKNADVTIRDCFDKTALDRSKDSYIIKMLQEAAEVGQEYEEKNEDQTQETKPEQHSFTPEQPNSKEQLHSILKKSGTKRDEYSRYADDDYVKVQDFNSQPNHTTASSIYHYQRPQEQRGYERRLHSPGKQDISTLHNDSRVSRDYNPLESRKASDPKLSTRFSRPRHDRHNYSMDRSYQLSSRSPAKSTMLTARNQKTTPLRSRDTVRSMTSPLSEAKRQNLKEDIQHDISTEVSSVSGRIKDIIQQKIALEVPQHMQSFEQTLGKELNTAFQFRMDSIFKSLHASFNLKVKFCLNKLGFDTAGLSLAPFTDEEILYKPNEKPFVDQVPKYNHEKEAKAIEKDISRLEKSVLSKSLLDRSMHSEINGDRHHHHHQDCVHTSFAARTQIKTELSEQLGQDVRSTTEYLVGFSNGKINEVVRNETSQIHQKMLDALTRSLDTVEDDFRRKFEEFINKKVNDLAASLTGSSHQVLVSSKKISPDLTPSKQLFSSKTSEKKITFNQESERPVQPEKPNASMDFVKTILKSPESQYSHKSSTSAYKEKDFAQTKGKIEKLKNSLNFIDDAIPSLGSEKNDESYRDNQKEVRRELHYHQLEAGDSSVRDISQGNLIRSSLLSERPEFTDSSKRELNDNIQVASKMDEIRKFYQNRYGNM